MPTLQIQLLGTFQVFYNNEPLTTISQARQRALLVYLLLHRHTPQSRRQLAFLFWPYSTETQAQANLRQLLHRLQRALPAVFCNWMAKQCNGDLRRPSPWMWLSSSAT
jgi:DNA-binding SARP family transcriptional activator